MAAEQQLKAMIKEILVAARRRWRRKFGRRDKGKDREEESYSGSDRLGGGGRRFFGMLGRRQVIPMWVDDTVQIHVDGWSGRAGVVCLPQMEIGYQEERVGRGSISKLCNNKRRILGL